MNVGHAGAAGFVLAVTVALACGSSSSKEGTGSEGTPDPADGCILAGDAGADGYPTSAELPSGACGGDAGTCESVVEAPCGTCGMQLLGLWSCACTGGTWSCSASETEATCPVCAIDGGGD